jgi:sigma-B regulation protein RsbQ
MPLRMSPTPLAREVRGTGEPVLLLGHGFGQDRSVWARVAFRLAANSTTIAYDVRGFGESAPSLADAGQWTLQVVADDLEALVTSFGTTPVVMIGNSFQGTAALAVASRRPANVVGVVAIGAAPRWVSGDDYPFGADPTQAAEIVAMLAADYRGTVERLAPAMFFNEPDREAAAASIAATNAIAANVSNPGALARVLEQIYREDIRADLAAIRCPVLLIHGELDVITPPAVGHDLAARLRDATVHVVQHAGHCLHMTYPDLVAARIEEFLRRLRS